MSLPKIVTIVGTNASGKSGLGILLAKAHKGEIISADSRQIYRGFDLCCGKITTEEMRKIPHHLLDIRDIGEPFSVFAFQELAYEIIPQIILRGKIPFIVGGTGQYVDSVVQGYSSTATPLNTALRDKYEKLPLAELQGMLPPGASKFFNDSDFQNRRRLIPAIIKLDRGEPLGFKNEPRYNALQLGVTWSKEELHNRIDERLDERIRAGMIDEVREYLSGGGNPRHLEELGLEYRYIARHLAGELGIGEFKLELSRAIKQFAKRQMTWFKRNKNIHWLDMSANPVKQASALIAEFGAE